MKSIKLIFLFLVVILTFILTGCKKPVEHDNTSWDFSREFLEMYYNSDPKMQFGVTELYYIEVEETGDYFFGIKFEVYIDILNEVSQGHSIGKLSSKTKITFNRVNINDVEYHPELYSSFLEAEETGNIHRFTNLEIRNMIKEIEKE
jgi:hypothetical protein